MSANTLPIDSKLIDAVSVIEFTQKRLAVILSDYNDVVGTLTDGDIRRALLQGGTLDTPAVDVMNNQPVTASMDESDAVVFKKLKDRNIEALPIVDRDGKYLRVLHISELDREASEKFKGKTFSAAVIMAGGEGTRLRPLTETIPKPMVDIRGVPLLERQVYKLKKAGIEKVYISVNYLGELIMSHFGDGSHFGVEINYLHESKKLGTAGALALMPEWQDDGPLIVMNGDVLTTSDFLNLYHFHIEHKSLITVSAIDYHVQIPYGVIGYEGSEVKELLEKPSQRFFCNAGIYALSPDVIAQVPRNSFFNMTDLIDKFLERGLPVSVFPVYEYWSDIGTPGDLERARKEYLE